MCVYLFIPPAVVHVNGIWQWHMSRVVAKKLSPSLRALSKYPGAKCVPKVFWGESVVFNELENDAPGTVVVDAQGKISACRPLETETRARQWATLKNKEFVRVEKGLVLSPGLIDVHCHISELGRDWEGYETATRSAAAGGITTLIGMPLNSIPATTTPEALRMEIDAALSQTLTVDVAYWGGVVPTNAEDPSALGNLIDAGVLGFKAFLSPLPPDAGFETVSPEQLERAAVTIGGFRSFPILVHSELMSTEEQNKALDYAYANSPNSCYNSHVDSRPHEWERRAVRVVSENCASVCRMHIVHLSDSGCLEIIEKAKSCHIIASNLSVETCPHYLIFDSESIPAGETRLKCFPPIRDVRNKTKLWQAGLKAGLISIIASDHSPCSPDMRLLDDGNVRDAWGGISGLQYQLASTWTAAKDNGCSLKDMARWWSENPSILPFGLSSIKGGIKVGNFADFVVWDPSHYSAPCDYSKERHRWTGSYLATKPLTGRVFGTWLGGQQVFDGASDTLLHTEASPGRVLLSRP